MADDKLREAAQKVVDLILNMEGKVGYPAMTLSFGKRQDEEDMLAAMLSLHRVLVTTADDSLWTATKKCDTCGQTIHYRLKGDEADG